MKIILQLVGTLKFFLRTRKSNFLFTFANAFAMLVTFLLIPTILEKYGIKFLGIFSLIISINSIIPLLDFGFCNALINAINRSDKLPLLKNQEHKINLFFLILPFAVLTSIGGIAFYNLIFLHKYFEGTLTISEIKLLITVLIFHSILLIFFNVAFKIRLAQNQFKLSSIILMANSFVLFAFSMAVMLLDYSFIVFIISYICSSWLVNLFFLPNALNAISLINKNSSRTSINILSKIGYIPGSITFFAIQLSTILAYQLDNFIISTFFSLSEVAIYATALKFVSVPISLLASYTLPLWMHTSQGAIGTSKQEIFMNLSRILKVRMLLVFPFAILLLITLPEVINHWSNGKLRIPFSLIFWLISWMLVSAATQPIAMVTNGMFYQRFILASGTLGALVNFIISLFLCMNFDLVVGPIIGSITAQLAGSLIPFLYLQSKVRAIA